MKKYNVFISFVPRGMTPILQMLDVSINRAFQLLYAENINEWLKSVISDDLNPTKFGNLKKTILKMVTDICHKFPGVIYKDTIIKSFEICRISKSRFYIEKLHVPLKKILLDEDIEKENLFFCEDYDFIEISIHQALNSWLKNWRRWKFLF
ncbi:hypothetical protein DMUE_5218 [Dictyocoela muelleri]|nr:hypothetical protein DMUE_5218 [Dictyocoela muelleri]